MSYGNATRQMVLIDGVKVYRFGKSYKNLESFTSIPGVGVQELGRLGPEDLHRPGDGCQSCTTTPLHSAFSHLDLESDFTKRLLPTTSFIRRYVYLHSFCVIVTIRCGFLPIVALELTGAAHHDVSP